MKAKILSAIMAALVLFGGYAVLPQSINPFSETVYAASYNRYAGAYRVTRDFVTSGACTRNGKVSRATIQFRRDTVITLLSSGSYTFSGYIKENGKYVKVEFIRNMVEFINNGALYRLTC